VRGSRVYMVTMFSASLLRLGGLTDLLIYGLRVTFCVLEGFPAGCLRCLWFEGC